MPQNHLLFIYFNVLGQLLEACFILNKVLNSWSIMHCVTCDVKFLPTFVFTKKLVLQMSPQKNMPLNRPISLFKTLFSSLYPLTKLHVIHYIPFQNSLSFLIFHFKTSYPSLYPFSKLPINSDIPLQNPPILTYIPFIMSFPVIYIL